MKNHKVKIGNEYYYNPVGMDIWDSRTDLKRGDKVMVINLNGCPPANTMGHCYVKKDGKFAGLILTNSLTKTQPLPVIPV